MHNSHISKTVYFFTRPVSMPKDQLPPSSRAISFRLSKLCCSSVPGLFSSLWAACHFPDLSCYIALRTPRHLRPERSTQLRLSRAIFECLVDQRSLQPHKRMRPKLGVVAAAILAAAFCTPQAAAISFCSGAFNEEFSGRCYWNATSLPARSWAAAQAACRAASPDATLAVVPNAAVLASIGTLISHSDEPIWIDGFVQPGGKCCSLQQSCPIGYEPCIRSAARTSRAM